MQFADHDKDNEYVYGYRRVKSDSSREVAQSEFIGKNVGFRGV